MATPAPIAEVAIPVTIDARGIFSSGIGRYLRAILDHLFRDPRFGRITLLGNLDRLRDYVRDEGVGEERVDLVDFDHDMYSVAAKLAWLARARRIKGGVTFFPHYDGPVFGMPPRSVVTVHDLIHFKVPAAFPLTKRAFAGILLRRVVQEAAMVIAISESTRRDLAARFPAHAGKVRVVHLGASDFFRSTEARSAPAAASDETEPFLLCVGNRKKHKNLVAAVETLALLAPDRPELKLVVVGRSFPEWADVVRVAEERGVASRLVELENVEDAVLRSLYNRCEAFLFPSLYEGFGLPLVEAMGCGAPVIASDRSSIPEVVGDAAILVDPHDHAAMAAAVTRLKSDDGLRRRLVAKGEERAVRFSWDTTAAIIADHLHAVGTATNGDRDLSPRAESA